MTSRRARIMSPPYISVAGSKSCRPSERQLQPQLQNSPAVSASRIHERIRAHIIVYRRELRVVEHIERFRPELDPHFFGGLEYLIYRHVKICPMRQVQAVAA